MGSECDQGIPYWRFQYIKPNAPFLRNATDDDYLQDNWDREATPLTRDEFGRWEVTLPAKNRQPAIPHSSKVKVSYMYSGLKAR